MTKQELYDAVARGDENVEYLDEGSHDGHGVTTFVCEFYGVKFTIRLWGIDCEMLDDVDDIFIHPSNDVVYMESTLRDLLVALGVTPNGSGLSGKGLMDAAQKHTDELNKSL